jgi:heme/copper-type cytochrome/quinol oxidase subunit 3
VTSATVQVKRKAPANGWWGVLLFVATEAMLFGLMIASYFYLRFNNAHWPPVGVEKPKVLAPLILTAVLVSTAVPLFLAVRSARLGRVRVAWLLIALALVVQAAYLGVQIHEFLADLDKMSPKDSAYASIYFTLIGAHHIHVAVGILIEVWLVTRLLGGMTDYRFVALRCTALYWYFVTALGVAVTFTQIYPSL